MVKFCLQLRACPLNRDGGSCIFHSLNTKDKGADVSRIKYENLKFKMFCGSNRLSDLENVFTVRLVATRSLKLNPILICFDNFFLGPKS
jgi:hypothetical protein